MKLYSALHGKIVVGKGVWGKDEVWEDLKPEVGRERGERGDFLQKVAKDAKDSGKG